MRSGERYMNATILNYPLTNAVEPNDDSETTEQDNH
jgi:hypothetical protein